MIRYLAVLSVACLLNVHLPAQDTPQPATVMEIKQAVDWDKLPKLQGATKVNQALDRLSYDAPGTFLQAAEFYRQQLPALGWIEDKTPIAGVDQQTYLYVAFDKGAMRMNISGYRAEPKGPMSISVVLAGNVDLRTLPRIADAQVKSAFKTAVIYTSKTKQAEVSGYCKKKLQELGWKEAHDETAAFHAKEGRTVMRFLFNAMELTVVVYQNKEGLTEATYTVGVQHDLKPADVEAVMGAGKVAVKPTTLKEAIAVMDFTKLPRLDGAEKLKQHKELMMLPWAGYYQAPGTTEATAQFYRKLFSEQGWKELPADIEIDRLIQLKFEKAGYLVNIGASQRDKLVQVSLVNTGNVDLRSLPYPEGARFSPARTDVINFATTLSKEAAFSFYREQLPKLGWKEAESRGKGTMKFAQNSVELRLEITDNTSGKTMIKLSTVLR